VTRQAAASSEEWWVQISGYARYIIFCREDGTSCATGSTEIRKIAAFQGIDPCLTEVQLNLTFGTIIPYQIVYTLPNEQTAVTFEIS
jgi:hypothetical protein